MQPDPLEFGCAQRPWLGPDLIRHPDPAEIVNVTRASGQCRRIGADARGQRGIAGESGHRARMPQGERAFQVDEVAERDQKRVQRSLIEALVVIGRRAQRRHPHVPGGRAGQDRFGVTDESVCYLGIELPAAPGADHGHGPLDAVLAVVNLDHVGDLSDAHLDRDRVTVGTGGQAAAVVTLESECERRLHVGIQTDSIGQQRRRCAVRVDQLRDAGHARW